MFINKIHILICTLLIFFLHFNIFNCVMGSDSFEEELTIAREVVKTRGKGLIIGNINRDHSGKNKSKSYFSSEVITQINTIIDETIKAPTSLILSKGNFMIIKDFPTNIGIHVTISGEEIASNRILLLFKGIDKIKTKGLPFDLTLGALITGYPGNPNITYQ